MEGIRNSSSSHGKKKKNLFWILKKSFEILLRRLYKAARESSSQINRRRRKMKFILVAVFFVCALAMSVRGEGYDKDGCYWAGRSSSSSSLMTRRFILFYSTVTAPICEGSCKTGEFVKMSSHTGAPGDHTCITGKKRFFLFFFLFFHEQFKKKNVSQVVLRRWMDDDHRETRQHCRRRQQGPLNAIFLLDQPKFYKSKIFITFFFSKYSTSFFAINK